QGVGDGAAGCDEAVLDAVTLDGGLGQRVVRRVVVGGAVDHALSARAGSGQVVDVHVVGVCLDRDGVAEGGVLTAHGDGRDVPGQRGSAEHRGPGGVCRRRVGVL